MSSRAALRCKRKGGGGGVVDSGRSAKPSISSHRTLAAGFDCALVADGNGLAAVTIGATVEERGPMRRGKFVNRMRCVGEVLAVAAAFGNALVLSSKLDVEDVDATP